MPAEVPEKEACLGGGGSGGRVEARVAGQHWTEDGEEREIQRAFMQRGMVGE